MNDTIAYPNSRVSGTLRKTILNTSALLLLVPSMAFAISPPQSLSGTEVAQSSVKWEWSKVADAVRYEVTVDGQSKGSTTDNQYYSHDLWIGEHSLTVRAITSNWKYSGQSATAKINVKANYTSSSPNKSFVVGQASSSSSSSSSSDTSGGDVDTPSNPRGSEVQNGVITWQWDAVSGATQYEITVDGSVAGLVSGTEYSSSNMWIGEHSMTVKSRNSSGQLSHQSDTVKVTTQHNVGTGSVSSTTSTSVVAPPPPSASANDNKDVDILTSNYPEASIPGYELTFSDEFNTNALNPVRWNGQLRWDGDWNGERYEYRTINGESQFYSNPLSNDQEHLDAIGQQYSPFEFDGSRLAIRAKRNPLYTGSGTQSHGPFSSMVTQQPFISGAIATYDKFSQKYGYFEARIKIPSHTGTFPAFWLHHQNRAAKGTHKSEIDIMENLGHAPQYVYNSFHYYNNVSTNYGGDPVFLKPQPEGQIYTGTDYSQDYHVYAVEWEPGYIRWLIDGKTVSELWNGNVNHEDLYIILNLAIGGNWTNYPTNSGGLGRSSNERFPTQNDIDNFQNPALEIDYVRAYERK